MLRRKIVNSLLPAALLLAAAACSRVPRGVMGHEKMAQFLADFHTGEAVVDMNRSEFRNDSMRQTYKQSVYAKHKVTPEEVDSSFAWYGRHMAEYIEVYDRAIEILDLRIIETGNRIAAEAALSVAGDSVDVWPYSRFITFNELSPSPFAGFSFRVDENWEKGDTYTWRGKFFNNSETLHWTVVAEYDNGMVETYSRTFSGDGWNEVAFQTDSTKTLTRFYGFIKGINRPGTSLHIDSMEMIRKRVNHDNPLSRYNLRTFSNFATPLNTPTDSIAK